jgi:CRP-like cAMP-binding protein
MDKDRDLFASTFGKYDKNKLGQQATLSNRYLSPHENTFARFGNRFLYTWCLCCYSITFCFGHYTCYFCGALAAPKIWKIKSMSTNHDALTQFVQSHFPMEHEKAQYISSIFQEHFFAKHELLIEQDKISDHYYFLGNGYVRSHLYNWQGEDVTLQLISPGKMVCELPTFFKRKPAQASFQALTDCRVLSIAFDDLQQAFHSMPEFREFGRAMLVNAFAEMQQRNIALIQQTAEMRYADLLAKHPDLFQHFPLKYIASYLGITDTSLSRIRKEVARK